MRVNRKLVISAMLLMVLFLCITASSAEGQINETVSAGDTCEVEMEEVPQGQSDEMALPQGTIYVSQSGDDSNDGKNVTSAVATIARAYDIVSDEGTVFLLGGEHECSGLTLNKSVSFAGENPETTIINLKNESGFVLNGSMNFLSFANITFINPNTSNPLFNLHDGNLNCLNISECRFMNVNAPTVCSSISDVEINLYRNYFELKQPIAVNASGSCKIEAHNNIFDGTYSSAANPILCDAMATGNMDYNYYGNNSRPVKGTIPFTYWVIANLTANRTEIYEGEEVQITVDFNHYTDGNANFSKDNLIPDHFNVTFIGDGDFTEKSVRPENGIASTIYSSGMERSDIISIEPTSLAVEISTFSPIVYVQPGASDDNRGTRTSPVGTIARALEIATTGQIVLLEGTHRTGDLSVIWYNMTIEGEGNVIIDAGNNNRILYVGEEAHVVIKNVIMINGYSIDESGALLGNTNELTLINCTLANSSAGENNGGAIFNVGKLTVINCTFSNCNAKMGGAIFTQTSGESVTIDIFNSTFENNVASGYNALGGGAVYVQRTYGFYNFAMTIDNTDFINNRALGQSCGGAIALAQLDATVKITGCKFIANHANGQDTVGGGAIYTTGADNYQRYGKLTVTGTLFENNTCEANGGAIFAKTTTVAVSESVFINNRDGDGLAVYGFKTDLSSPSITLNDNWWGSNENPKGLVGGNSRYSPTLSRWAVLTVTNDTPIVAGSTVRLTASINNSTSGALSKPITVKRDVTLKTNFGDINGTLENGEFSFDYSVPNNLKYILATVDSETQTLYAVPSKVTIQMADISGRKFDKVDVTVNVTSDVEVDVGNIELYVGNDRIASFEVKGSRAAGEVIISNDVGNYVLTARYVGGTPFFDDGEANATMTVEGIIQLYNLTFFNFFDDEGLLRDEYLGNELVFHGEFSDLGVDAISIPRPLVIIGDNAKLHDISLSVLSGDVKVSNMTFINAKGGAAVSVIGDDVEITNVLIDCTALKTADSYAVLANSANGFRLSNSTVIFNSENAGAVHHALHIAASDDINISGNVINASLTARDVDWHYTEPYFDSIDQDMVLAVGIQDCLHGILTENEINVIVNGANGYDPTVDAVILYGVNDFEVSWNSITQTDTVNAGLASYSNALDLYAFDGITISYNNILVNSTSGIEAKGTAYPIQATGPYGALTIEYNNLTSISNGPALGIYSQNYDGVTDITVTFNRIDVIGFATENNYALVSGMELQDTRAKVYNNTIFSQSKGSYGDLYSLYGISYAQDTEGPHTYDIMDNIVITEGKYAIYLKSAKDSHVSGNTLYAHELKGNDAVWIIKANNSVVESNRPEAIELTVAVEDVTVGSDAVINVTSNVDAEGTIIVLINNKTYGNATFNGSKQIPVAGLAAGDYNVTVIFKSGDINYLDCENGTSFNVAKLEAKIVIDVASSAMVGETVVINVSCDSTSALTVLIDGENVNVSDGKITYKVIRAGLHTVNAFALENDMYKQVNETETFNASKNEAIITLNQFVNVNVGDTIVIVPETNSDGALTIKVNNEVTDGIYTICSAGFYAITVESAETEMYESGFANGNFTAFKKASSVNVTVNPGKALCESWIIINVTEGASGEIIVELDSVEVYRGLVNETVMVSLGNLKAGNHTVNVTYAGDDCYNSSFYAEEFKIFMSESSVSAYSVEIVEGNIASLTVNVNDGATGKVIVVIDGTEHYGVISNSSAIVAIADLTAGHYNAAVTYLGDERYDASSNNASVNVKRKLSSDDFKIDVNIPQGSTSPKFTISLPGDATGNLTVIVDGKTSLTQSLISGSATVNVGKLSYGKHNVQVVYSGDGKYSAISKNVQLTIKNPAKKKLATKFIAKKKTFRAKIKTKKYTVTLKAGKKPVKKVRVTIKIKGKLFKAKTNAKGKATFKIKKLNKKGKYTVVIKFGGNKNFKKTSKKVRITVKK